MTSVLASEFEMLRRFPGQRVVGRVAELRGLSVLVDELPLPVGALVRIDRGVLEGAAWGEVVGFSRDRAIVMLLSRAGSLRAGQAVVGEQASQVVGVGESMIGRVLDGMGRAIDGGPALGRLAPAALEPDPVAALSRGRVKRQLLTGVRAIDLMTPVGRGQRLGIFAGPGVGKSTLLGQIARDTSADLAVVALIGERGREVRDFIEDALGEAGMRRAIVFVATGDESPVMRVRAAKMACAAAEHFRDHGRSVLLMMDSVTRFAHAQRQIGLAVGEPPATKGYTPSVFASMALLLERAGALDEHAGGGSITGLYTILVEGDDMTEPVADAARGILDGHVVLSRRLAQSGHFPAIDVLQSVSRVADDVTDRGQGEARRQVVRMMAAYREVEELVQVGAYAAGSSPEADAAIVVRERIASLLRQGRNERMDFARARDEMVKVALESGEDVARRRAATGQVAASPRGRSA
ncbi:MAG: FliI/YscN family ATPase [Phycisphaerales bacterium]|nr:FliI/YscN family ATPase [Phycisphaerales bacterium]